MKGQVVAKVVGEDLSELQRTVEAMRREFRQAQGLQRAATQFWEDERKFAVANIRQTTGAMNIARESALTQTNG